MGWTVTGKNYTAEITCFSGANAVANILFMKEGAAIPDNNKETFSNFVRFYYPISRFNDIISILRYEKPLRFVFDTADLSGYLDTSTGEPTGEQEG